MNRQKMRGFTLFEMLAVLVLLGLIATLMGYAMQNSLRHAAEKKAVVEMVNALRSAKTRALVSGKPQRVTFDLRQRRFYLPGEQGESWPQGLRITLNTAEGLGSSYAFYPEGGASGGNIVIVGQQRWRIDIAWLTGTASLSQP